MGNESQIWKGIWVVKPPQGYDIVRTNGERKIVVNADGKKIKSMGMETNGHEEWRKLFWNFRLSE